MNHADGVVGVERHTALEMRYRQIILITETVDLSEERVASAFARIQSDRGRGRSSARCLISSDALP